MTNWVTTEVKNYIVNKPDSDFVIESGFGASAGKAGIHIGTLAENLRSNWIRNEYERQTSKKGRFITFSDDRDALRKIPEDISVDFHAKWLGVGVSDIPDEFGVAESFGDRCNTSMKKFLTEFEINSEFISSNEYYHSGQMNAVLEDIWDNYDEVMNVIMPTLQEDRRKTYSPFMPICKYTNKVLMVSVTLCKPEVLDFENFDIVGVSSVGEKCIGFVNPFNNRTTIQSIYNGNIKLQWYVDWVARWKALNIGFEFHGKDLLDSASLGAKLAKVLSFSSPQLVMAELFLDETGQKISKSKGNGVSIEQWLKYGSKESLAYFIFGNPRRAKNIFIKLIPKMYDEYIKSLEKYHSQSIEEQLDNPVHHIFNGKVPELKYVANYSMILTLIRTLGSHDASLIFKTLKIELSSHMAELINAVINYDTDFGENREFVIPNNFEKNVLEEMCSLLQVKEYDGDALQFDLYELGKKHYGTDKKELLKFFKMVYGVLLGAPSGPRLGEFICLYGQEKIVNIIKNV